MRIGRQRSIEALEVFGRSDRLDGSVVRSGGDDAPSFPLRARRGALEFLAGIVPFLGDAFVPVVESQEAVPCAD